MCIRDSVEGVRQMVYAQIPAKILVDIAQDIQNLHVAVVGINEFQPVLSRGAVQMYHEFQE